MKALKIKQLDEKDEEIADILISLGMSRSVAMSLTYLQNMNSATSVDLERVGYSFDFVTCVDIAITFHFGLCC